MTVSQSIDAIMARTQEQYARYVELVEISDIAAIPSEPEFGAPLPTPLGFTFGAR